MIVGAASGGGGILLVYLVIAVLSIAGMWQVFNKAGRPGWAAIIPFYNTYTLCKTAGRPGWWLILFFIPIVNIITAIVVLWDLGKAFGKSEGFSIGLVLLSPIFICILGFGSSTYVGT
jgi:hypothetical protein